MSSKVNKVLLSYLFVILIIATAFYIRGPREYDPAYQTPAVTLRESFHDELDYSILIVKATPSFPLNRTMVFLYDPAGTEIESHFIDLHYDSEERMQGIDITWDNRTDVAYQISDRNYVYVDPIATQARIDQVMNGSDENASIRLSFIDNDENGRISPGDVFYLDGHREGGFYDYRGYTLRLRFHFNVNDPEYGEYRWGPSLELSIFSDIEMTSKKVENNNYTVKIDNWWLISNVCSISLLDPDMNLVRSHNIALREDEGGEWIGINIRMNDTLRAQLPEAARVRIDDIKNGSDAKGPIYMWYYDGIHIHPVESGDIESFDGYWIKITLLPTGENLGEIQLRP